MARSTGTRALRVAEPRLLTGTSTHVADVVRPGMPHARFVRSPVARARISGIDVSRALRLDRVHGVFTAQDPNCRVREQWYTFSGRDDPDTPRPPLAEDAAESVDATHAGNLVGEPAGRPRADVAPDFDRAPHEVRSFCVRPPGVDEHRVRVAMRHTGGGFGQKVLPWREIPEGAFRSRFVFSDTSGRAPYRDPWQFESTAREDLLDTAAPLRRDHPVRDLPRD
ncbi:hypothetical protein ACIPSJ_25500 [Streptomyces sp. NPDC090088]|uniref:hypothetical protein n=1 Tax=Streptomyces sp. NPDC090088 TaxID=3365944 RepID=UPI00382F4CAA